VSQPTFQPPPDVYDALIDWPARLANESPFYRKLFNRFHVHSVLDAACGSGRHAAMFREWGLLVEGADASAAMLALARAAFGESNELRWVERSFETPPPASTFDAAICVGNSLALAPDHAAAERTIRALLSAVRPGGAVVLQVLNLWRFPEGAVVWQKFRRAAIDGVQHRLIKGVHRAGGRGFVELLDWAEPDPTPRVDQPQLLALRAAEVDAIARRAGAAEIEFYGDYSFGGYDEDGSTDLIAVLLT
jgi:SAM-dependent methyltransferase